ncbi:MAG: ROK family protein [Acidobacteriaceae bacterium]|nr:ROK family protein [Acidobacteriaceae bacterium]
MLGGIEAGGTKFVCGVGSGPSDLETAQFPTTSPGETIDKVIGFFRRYSVSALGIASFGPVDLDPSSPSYGHITSTPKPEWGGFDLLGEVKRALRVPARLDTDVNGAILGEARWGAARGLQDAVYITIGTGIGGGALVGGRVVHGLVHPEMGHLRFPHDVRDSFPGICPYHGDCFEGLASGPALEQRWGKPARELPADHPAWPLEARYIALGLANLAFALSPRRFLLGGGVMQQPHLFAMIREEFARILAGYVRHRDILDGLDEYIQRPQLDYPGVLGALVLAEHAADIGSAQGSHA